MKEWKDDETWIRLMKEKLYTAVVGDIMEKMGYVHRFFVEEPVSVRAMPCNKVSEKSNLTYFFSDRGLIQSYK